MTVIQSGEFENVFPAQTSAWSRFVAAIHRMLFGSAPKQSAIERAADIVANDLLPPNDDASPGFIIAPGGYRIRVPQRDEVHQTIDNMLPSVRQGLDLVPPLPTVVAELLREVQNPSASAASVADILSSDPALVASLIRTVNSAAFGLYRKITSVTEAVNYLGFASVKAMVLRLQLDRVLNSKNPSSGDVEDVWIHSLVVSYIADCLARRVSGVDAGFVSTLGLLHDIGKLVTLAQFHEQSEAIKNQGDGETSLDRETKIMGVDHAVLGATLAAKWKLPGDLVRAIRWHHIPERAFEAGDPKQLHQAVYLVQIANQLAKYCYVYGDETEIDAVSDAAFESLGLKNDLFALLDTDVRAAASRAIFFATEGSARPPTAVRRFLTLHRGESAVKLLETAKRSQVAPTVELLDSTDDLFDAPEPDGATRWRATVVTHENAVRALLADLHKQLALPEGSHGHHATANDAAFAMSMIGKSVLANTVGHAPVKVDAVVLREGQSVKLAIRSDCLAFSTRLAEEVDTTTARRVLDAELANLLNLHWVDSIGCSADGSTLVFKQNGK